MNTCTCEEGGKFGVHAVECPKYTVANSVNKEFVRSKVWSVGKTVTLTVTIMEEGAMDPFLRTLLSKDGPDSIIHGLRIMQVGISDVLKDQTEALTEIRHRAKQLMEVLDSILGGPTT